MASQLDGPAGRRTQDPAGSGAAPAASCTRQGRCTIIDDRLQRCLSHANLWRVSLVRISAGDQSAGLLHDRRSLSNVGSWDWACGGEVAL